MTALAISVALLALAAVAGLVLLLRVGHQLSTLQRQLVPLRQQVTELAEQTGQLQRAHQKTAARADGFTDQQRRLAARASRELRTTHRSQRDLQREVVTASKRVDRLQREQRDQVREMEALLQLFDGLSPRAAMPASGRWALNPSDLLELWTLLDRLRPKQVLELGSGTSSVWLGYALERFGGRLVSVEHLPQFADRTRAQLQRHALAEVAEVREAPLCPVTLAREVAGAPLVASGEGGEGDGQVDPFPWYDPDVFTDLVDVDLVLVDGPPGATRRHARLPALPMLRERLVPHATVILDDLDRSDEQEIVQQWLAVYPDAVQEPTTHGKLAVLTL